MYVMICHMMNVLIPEQTSYDEGAPSGTDAIGQMYSIGIF